MNEERRRKAAARAAVKRRLAKLAAAKDLEDLDRLIEEQNPRPQPRVVEAEPEVIPSGRTGWPTDAAIAAHQGISETLWGNVQQILKGSKYYALSRDEATILINGTSPILAEFLPTLGDTPLAGFVVALGVVFGPKAIRHAKDVYWGDVEIQVQAA